MKKQPKGRAGVKGHTWVPVQAILTERSVRRGDCIIWIGVTDSDGYGLVTIARGCQFRAHRLAWELQNGPIPPGIFVCHKCDVPPCINLAHLFLGSAEDNNRDKIRKGRTGNLPVGERHPNAKLSALDVREIRRLRALGMKLNEIATHFGIAFQYVSDLCSGKGSTWKSLE
jgi:hypothetical protein